MIGDAHRSSIGILPLHAVQKNLQRRIGDSICRRLHPERHRNERGAEPGRMGCLVRNGIFRSTQVPLPVSAENFAAACRNHSEVDSRKGEWVVMA